MWVPVTVNQINSSGYGGSSFWIACGAVCYNKHVCSNLIATCRKITQRSLTWSLVCILRAIIAVLNPQNGLVHSTLSWLCVWI